MTEPTAADSSASRPAGLLSRFVGVIVSPAATLTGVAANPRWIGMMAIVAIVTAVCTGAFLSTEVGRQALLDEQVNRMEAFGLTVSDAQYERMQQSMRFSAYLGAGQFLVFIPLVMAVLAGILYGIFNAGLGGDARYKQVLAIVAHAGALTAIQQVFVTPLNYARESMSSPTNLTVFLPMLDESSFLARLLGTIDLFVLWWVVVLAIGMAVLYRRRTSSILTGFLVAYGVIAVAVASIMSALNGSS